MFTIDSPWVLFLATAPFLAVTLGSAGAWLLMPPGRMGKRLAGVALAATAMGLWASQLPRLDNWLDDALVCLPAILAVVAAMATITARTPAYYLSAFVGTALGTAALMLPGGAWLPAATVAVVHAGLIPAGLWLMLRRAGRNSSTSCDRPSREPLLAAVAGMVTIGVLWGALAGALGERGSDHQSTLLHNGAAVGALLLGIGLIGLLGRRETVVMLLASQVMLLGASLSLIAFGRFHNDAAANTFALWIAVAAVCQIVVGVAVTAMLLRPAQRKDAGA
ncbi:MAG: NADH-quinone oxidoreductase subunit K [Candidatus Nealsonbacteria bacterium]|nr:NADH-quinone oxidoreductase subunit K [Candidatus Nealsonbacteria bacterium]